MSTGTGPGELSALRAAIYRFILLAFDMPSAERHRQLLAPSFRASLGLICDQFDLAIPGEELVPQAYADYESRYIATFEVGLPAPPVVLLASHHLKHEPAPRVVHEHILFYKFFDAAPAAETGEAADHLTNEIRFLIHLEELRQRNPAAHDSAGRARADFLDRLMLRWVPAASAEAGQRAVPEFYRLMLRLLDAVLREDRRLTETPDMEPARPC